MNDDYVRKDLYERDLDNITGLISDTSDRLDDYKDSTSRQLTF